MDRVLRRYIWVIDLIGIAIGAALAGDAAAQLIAARLPGATSPPGGAPIAALAPAPPDKSIQAIVARNIFSSEPARELIPERSTRALTLLAIMFAPPPGDPRWSLAIVRDDESATTGPYGVGARLGDATIEAIEDVRVVLDAGHGRRELLELLHRRRGPADGRRAPTDSLVDGVRKTGTHSYEIRRAALDALLAGGIALPMPRVVRQMREGQPTGLRLYGVDHEGAFGAIGLMNGDLLLAVNGRSIATPDSALSAYTALRTASHVWLMIERAGQRIRMDYTIR